MNEIFEKCKEFFSKHEVLSGILSALLFMIVTCLPPLVFLLSSMVLIFYLWSKYNKSLKFLAFSLIVSIWSFGILICFNEGIVMEETITELQTQIEEKDNLIIEKNAIIDKKNQKINDLQEKVDSADLWLELFTKEEREEIIKEKQEENERIQKEKEEEERKKKEEEERLAREQEEKEEQERIAKEEDKYVDNYPNGNGNPSSNLDSINQVVETTIEEGMGNGNFDVGVEKEGNTIVVNIIAYDVNVIGFSRSDIDILVKQAGLNSALDNMSIVIQQLYREYGYNFEVKVIAYDRNGTVLYRCYS